VLVVVAVLCVAVAAVAASAAVARRAVRLRIDAATARLGEEPRPRPRPGLDASLDRLERATETIALRVGSARGDTARMAQALDVIGQGVVVCDASGIEVFRNRVAEAFVGARHAEVLVERAVHEALAGALAGTRHRRHLDVLGPPRRMLDIIAVPLDDGAASTGAIAIIDDVSERNRLEAVRRDFVANISHELKTPVGALGVLAETIVAEEDPAVTRRLAERMTDEAHRVGRIIDDLLALSRIEAEEQKVREAVSVLAIVEEAVERMRSIAEAHDVTIASDGVGRRHTLRGDRPQLVSAIANLLENACKYSDDGSTVRVASSTDGTWVEITVRDEGIGIPTTDLERVFERFYRVDRARSRETGGTGLGLSIVRHIAGNHGGEVRVESSEGQGSTFTVRFPAGPGAVPGEADHQSREAEPA
jgi:two-component system sensor histidine kinase SenX3